MSGRDSIEVVGRVSRNPYADLTVAVSKYRGRYYIQLETVSSETGLPFDPERPRILSIQPETIRELIPLLSSAQELVARLAGRE